MLITTQLNPLIVLRTESSDGLAHYSEDVRDVRYLAMPTKSRMSHYGVQMAEEKRKDGETRSA